MTPAQKRRYAVRGNKIEDVDENEVDFVLESPNRFFGSHINTIPLQSAVQAPRLFYGARFVNQAMPIAGGEAPLVQAQADDDERSFDEILGEHVGAIRAKTGGVVRKVTPTAIEWDDDEGKPQRTPLYNSFSFNRKTQIHHTPRVKEGDRFTPGQLLARSNYTDDNGVMAMGLNARVALIPYKGHSMDDAVVVSEDFAKRLKSEHMDAYDAEFDGDIKPGTNHFISLFPTKFKKEQLANLDDLGVVKPGTVLRQGDPMILATKPKTISSSTAALGKLSKAMREARADASQIWDNEEEGVVTDVAHTKNGVKVFVKSLQPSKLGDKVVLRSGQKGIISKILPQDHMPRTADGQPLDVLLNSLGLPSRVNSSLLYELLLGKAAKADGKPYKVKSFNRPDEKWYDLVEAELAKRGLSKTEEVFDPQLNRKLENPVTVGYGTVLKLHHVASSKISGRGQGSYNADQQPAKGGGEAAQSKRLSGLESAGLLAAGAYGVLREGSVLRGSRNDDYWRKLRAGQTPAPPGVPFVFSKFRALLNGAGLHTSEKQKGKLRLGPFTDRHLEEMKPIDVENGEMVDLATLEPIKGGLFDQGLVGSNKYGRIRLPVPVPNPSMEETIRKLLGVTEKQFRGILAGTTELPEHLR